MKVFISQSGERSKRLAFALKEALPFVLPSVEPWVSDLDIAKGTQGFFEIDKSLRDSAGGIVCLTSDNFTQPWILFEAGSLLQLGQKRVWTVLLDMANTAVPPPLGLFQHTQVAAADLLRLFSEINELSETRRPKEHIEMAFRDSVWPKLESVIAELKTRGPAIPPKREVAAMVAEILDMVRAQSGERATSALARSLLTPTLVEDANKSALLRALGDQPPNTLLTLLASTHEPTTLGDFARLGQLATPNSNSKAATHAPPKARRPKK